MNPNTEPNFIVKTHSHIQNEKEKLLAFEREDAMRLRLESALSALNEIADYDQQSIWSDDRDDAANDMLRIARKAIGREGE